MAHYQKLPRRPRSLWTSSNHPRRKSKLLVPTNSELNIWQHVQNDVSTNGVPVHLNANCTSKATTNQFHFGHSTLIILDHLLRTNAVFRMFSVFQIRSRLKAFTIHTSACHIESLRLAFGFNSNDLVADFRLVDILHNRIVATLQSDSEEVDMDSCRGDAVERIKAEKLK